MPLSAQDKVKAVEDTIDPIKAADGYIEILFNGIEIGPVQRNELRKAFVAGIVWLQEIELNFIATLSDESAGALMLQRIQQQCLQFALGLKDNGQGGMTSEELKVPPKH